MQEKHIALVCQHFYPEMLSTGLLMTQLAVGLTKRGWSLRVYCGQPVYQDATRVGERYPKREVYKGVEIVRVGALGSGRKTILSRMVNWLTFLMGVALYLWRDRKQLEGVINTTNPSIIGVVALFARCTLGLPYVTIVHDIYPDIAVQLGILKQKSRIRAIWSWLTQRILRQSRGIIVLGRDMLQLVAKKVGSADTPIVVIPNWADPEILRFIPPEQNRFMQEHDLHRHFVVQYAGRMGRTHNLEVLLDSAEILRDHPILFQFIGDGTKRNQLARLARQNGLHNVQFLPYQPIGQLAETLSAADLAVVCLDKAHTGVSVPSRTYGIMACGRPILALLDAASEIGRTIQEAECGIVLPDATGDQVATNIQALAENATRLTCMSDNSYRAFQQRFTLPIALQSYDRYLRQWFDTNGTEPATPKLNRWRGYAIFRRTLDIVFSLLGGVALLFLIPFVWLANLTTSPGPLFYWQERVGLSGQPFRMVKLRSMHVNAEANGVQWAEKDDSRVTRIGRILRKTHLDELPQAYNVLRGEMSIIGPRPERPEFTALLTEQIPNYQTRHLVKPGITGWAQVNQEHSASVDETRTKLDYDLYYVHHRNWRLDMRILIRTIGAIVMLRGH